MRTKRRKYVDEYEEEFIEEKIFITKEPGDTILVDTNYIPIKKPKGYYQDHLTPREQKLEILNI
jgi:hypothetical protein